MKIKVCGLTQKENTEAIANLGVDYVGFIFYDKSPRDVKTFPDVNLPKGVKRVGVFVNSSFDTIKDHVEKYQLDAIQLHGDENPDFCSQIKTLGKETIKAFSVGEGFQFEILEHYKPHCDFFLFDSRGEHYGGNGTVFNWFLLKKYDNEIPFILSGGISKDHIDRILAVDYLNIAGIDVNSKYEIEPGVKNVELVKDMVEKVRSYEQVPSR